MKYFYHKSRTSDVFVNFATEMDLQRYVSSGIVILYLWQNNNTIVIGRNQNTFHECKAKEFVAAGGSLARRKSGGGAVFHDMGNLNFSILSYASETEKCKYQKIISDVLSFHGVKSEFNGRNDILVNGKKCSGNATYFSGQIVCQHGTLLIDTDLEKMAYYLTPEKSKLDRNHVNSVPSRVINLRSINKDYGIESWIEAFVDVTNARELEYKPDQANIEKLTNYFKSDEWVYGGKR